MGFREVSVVSIREVLRLWLMNHGVRAIARIAGIDRKTVRRYVAAARIAGLSPKDGPDALTDEVIGVVDLVRPGRRPRGHGHAWDILAAHRGFLEQKLDRSRPHPRQGPHAAFETLEGAGHSFHRDSHRDFWLSVQAFLSA
jgi:hypothetical protein